MTNIGEGAISTVDPAEKCPICGKPPHPDRTTTAKKEGKGCLKSIPKNLSCSQIGANPDLPNFATAAHHLIPVNQCLKAYPRLSQICDTVGYDVNNSNNGLSLPTCGQKTMNEYASSDGKTKKYGKLILEDKKNASFVIMEGLNLQWHVGHHNWKMDLETDGEVHPINYDQLVKAKLRDLEKEFVQDGEDICEPEDGESGVDIIADMDALSEEVKGKVLAWNRYYVSAMAYRFFDKYKR